MVIDSLFKKDAWTVAKWSLQSRVALLCLQAVLHAAIPDHSQSMEDVFMKVHRSPPHPLLVEYTLGGLDNWDAEYFIFNAHSGYDKHEQTMAFFPLLSLTMRFLASTLLLPLSWLASPRSVMLISGVLINTLIFPMATILFYYLTSLVMKDRKVSLLAAALFCLNPASVFMVAVYSETLFSLFTISALVATVQKHHWVATAAISLASATRSNGLVLCGFPIYYHLEDVLENLFFGDTKWCGKICHAAKRLSEASIQTLVAIGAFLGFQYYGYFLYCREGSARSGQPQWCNWTVPIPYFYVQDRYWDVGFLRYFQLKQLPNFLLATPMVCLVLYSSSQYFCGHLERWLREDSKGKTDTGRRPFWKSKLRPFIFHLSFLTTFGIFNMHVQVLTRFISSSSPVIYWVAAICLLRSLATLQATELVGPNSSLTQMVQGICQTLWRAGGRGGGDGGRGAGSDVWISKAILLYFLVYIVLGCALHCNFYPWT